LRKIVTPVVPLAAAAGTAWAPSEAMTAAHKTTGTQDEAMRRSMT
jgi:hypothetical protein